MNTAFASPSADITHASRDIVREKASALVQENALAFVRGKGFAFVRATEFGAMLGLLATGEDWHAFAESWNGMPRDTYMADGGRYRSRRHATLSAQAGVAGIKLEGHQPHYQSLDYNTLNGGIARWFEPIPQAILEGPVFLRIFDACRATFDALKPQASWHIEAHQFRIQATPDEAGKPTPEGVHRDGVDYVLVMMVRRQNIASGTTTIHAPDGELLDRFTLADPLDAALVDDHRCLHGVTPVVPLDAAQPAYRDVLVVTFRATPSL
jgi:hypothetical protein